MCVWEGIFVILAGLHWLIVEPDESNIFRMSLYFFTRAFK